jgi:hypothetical protein
MLPDAHAQLPEPPPDCVHAIRPPDVCSFAERDNGSGVGDRIAPAPALQLREPIVHSRKPSARHQRKFKVTEPTAGTLASGTPILDRQVPVPRRAAPGTGLTVVPAVWIGIALLVAACWLLNSPPILRQWFVTDFRPWLLDQWTALGVVGFGLSLLGAFYLMLAVHELGHVLAGLCVGFRCRSLRVGPLLFNRPFQLSLYRGPGAVVNGVAELSRLTEVF